MIRIVSPHPLDKLAVGTIIPFRIECQEQNVETRLFLRQGGVFYMKPVADWQERDEYVFVAESPGRYTLVAEWRRGEQHGRSELQLTVAAPQPVSTGGPHKLRRRSFSLWTPSRWDALELGDSEAAVLDYLPKLVRPGDVIYDIGANVGYYALHLARLATSQGRLYCLEANPICVHYLRANLEIHGAHHAEILPVAALDRTGETLFTLNYGNSNLGLTTESPFYASKAGHEIRVACSTLDDLISTYGLKPPDLVKLDVEGVEDRALKGMRETLHRDRPALVLELHGEGNARSALSVLEELGYRYTDPKTDRTFRTAAEVCDTFGNVIFQLVARPAQR